MRHLVLRPRRLHREQHRRPRRPGRAHRQPAHQPGPDLAGRQRRRDPDLRRATVTRISSPASPRVSSTSGTSGRRVESGRPRSPRRGRTATSCTTAGATSVRRPARDRPARARAARYVQIALALHRVRLGLRLRRAPTARRRPTSTTSPSRSSRSRARRIAAREIDLAQDNFPERGDIDLANLANNWVRFDMARNISPDADLRNDPGDSIFVDIGLPRAGSVLNEHAEAGREDEGQSAVRRRARAAADFTQTGDIIDGWVYGDSTFSANGTVVPNRYNFDLPDSNFFFPGDVIHYYIEARTTSTATSAPTTLPADISALRRLRRRLPVRRQQHVHRARAADPAQRRRRPAADPVLERLREPRRRERVVLRAEQPRLQRAPRLRHLLHQRPVLRRRQRPRRPRHAARPSAATTRCCTPAATSARTPSATTTTPTIPPTTSAS